MASSATIPHSDIVFRSREAGDRALVFVHGFLDDQHVWDPVIAALKTSEYEIVQVDLAGFGDRPEAAGPFTYDRFAADLSAVVDAVGKPFVLVGHSMAAPVVELVAAARPDRALGLVLVSPIPMAGTRLPDEAFESFRALGELAPAEFRAFRQQVAPSAPEDEVARLGAVAAKFRPEVVRTVANVWNNGYPASERPSGFSGPVLILRGTEDPLLTEEAITSAVTARFNSATTTVTAIEQAGHWLHIERPVAMAAQLDGFLTEYLAVPASGLVTAGGE
jgi:pimeloyl-ACP methyl ester carboxylesterase